MNVGPNKSLTEALAAGVPDQSVAIYARWWQIETWLRELIYTELRAVSGLGWAERFESASRRLDQDRENAYMASADADDRLAYADFRLLLKVVSDDWQLFECALPPRVRWEGLVDSLVAVRNRNAHCRRPHQDDLGRLEQALRDLEPGAREFYRSYARTQHLAEKNEGPVLRAWVERRDPAAVRLIDHCESRYDVRFALRLSRRPWAEKSDEPNWSGRPGFFGEPNGASARARSILSRSGASCRARFRSFLSTCSSLGPRSPQRLQRSMTPKRSSARSGTSSIC